jgi:hypothetical protein
MNMNWFRAFGVLVIVVVLPFVGFLNSRPTKHLILLSVLAIVGLGLVNLRKWAALYFSALLLFWGIWMFLDAVKGIQFPWNLFCMVEALSLILPAFVTYRLWSYLSWRGKWFF